MPTFQFYKGGAKVHEIQGADIASVEAKTNELNGVPVARLPAVESIVG